MPKKHSFLTRVKSSIFKFEEYEKFIGEPLGKAFSYFFKLIAIVSFVITLVFIYTLRTNITVYLVMPIVTFILYSIIILLDVITLSVLGLILNLLIRTRFKYKDLVKISIYAMTLPILLYLLYLVANSLFGITIKYFQLAYSAISYIYLITVMLIIKADVIKNMQELQNVLEEQKKVKEELKRQAEEEQEKQRQKQKEKEDEKKGKTPQEPQTENG